MTCVQVVWIGSELDLDDASMTIHGAGSSMSSSSSYILIGSWPFLPVAGVSSDDKVIKNFGDVTRLLRCYGIIKLNMGG